MSYIFYKNLLFEGQSIKPQEIQFEGQHVKELRYNGELIAKECGSVSFALHFKFAYAIDDYSIGKETVTISNISTYNVELKSVYVYFEHSVLGPGTWHKEVHVGYFNQNAGYNPDYRREVTYTAPNYNESMEYVSNVAGVEGPRKITITYTIDDEEKTATKEVNDNPSSFKLESEIDYNFSGLS